MVLRLSFIPVLLLKLTLPDGSIKKSTQEVSVTTVKNMLRYHTDCSTIAIIKNTIAAATRQNVTRNLIFFISVKRIGVRLSLSLQQVSYHHLCNNNVKELLVAF